MLVTRQLGTMKCCSSRPAWDDCGACSQELSFHYFNEKGITFGPETKQLSVDEAQQARQDHVNRLDIAALYNQVDASSHRKADLWCDLADFSINTKPFGRWKILSMALKI